MKAKLNGVRRLAASGATLAAAVLFFCFIYRERTVMLYMPPALLALAAVLSQFPGLGAQLFTRATLWSNFLLTALITTNSASSFRGEPLLIALTSGLAILLLGRSREPSTPSTFAPIAFRSTLQLMLVMALSDVQSLLLFSTVDPGEYFRERRWLLVVCVALVVSCIGLFRLRVWGLLLNVVGNVTLIVLAWIVDLPTPLRWAYSVTAAIQLIAATPIWIALARGGFQERRAESRVPVGSAIAAVIVIVCTACWMFNFQLLPTR